MSTERIRELKKQCRTNQAKLHELAKEGLKMAGAERELKMQEIIKFMDIQLGLLDEWENLESESTETGT
jgi:hypothetical protein